MPEHNRLDFGALLKSIIGGFKSIIGSSLTRMWMEYLWHGVRVGTQVAVILPEIRQLY